MTTKTEEPTEVKRSVFSETKRAADELTITIGDYTPFIREISFTAQDIKVYRKRWLILALYVACMVCNSVQCLQYSIISNILARYYAVTNWQIDLTSLIMMACYLPLACPVSYFLDKLNLKTCILIGIYGTTTGSFIKIASATPDGYYITFLGQTIVALSQIFLISLPPKLSSIWFGKQEGSLAGSIAMFGCPLGFTIGFMLSPMMISNHDNLDLISQDLTRMFLMISFFCTLTALATAALFEVEPKKPPSLTQAVQSALSCGNQRKAYFKAFKDILKQPHCVLLFLTASINNGCFSAITTLLNQIFIFYFPHREQDGGEVGVTMMIGGMISSILFGIILDKTKRFKEITLFIYFCGSCATVLFIYALESRNLVAAYGASFVLGMFLSGFTSVSFDVAAEITYPESEVITATIMNMTTVSFSICLTSLFSRVLETYGCYWCGVSCAGTLWLGACLMLPLKVDLKRQNLDKFIAEMQSSAETPSDSDSGVLEDDCDDRSWVIVL